MKKHSLPILVALNFVLALVLGSLWLTTSGQLRKTRWEPPVAQTTDYAALVPVLPGLAPADTRSFIGMLDRPLFSPTRRPPPPPPPPKEQQAVDALSGAQLTGLFQGGGDGGVIIRLGDKHRRARLNESVDGWTLTSIQDRSATFTRAGQSRELQLPRALLANGPVAPQTAPPASIVPRVPQPEPALSTPPPAAGVPAAPAVPRTAKPLQPVFGGS